MQFSTGRRNFQSWPFSVITVLPKAVAAFRCLRCTCSAPPAWNHIAMWSANASHRLAQSHFTLPFDPSLGGSGCPVNSLWTPAFAGITAETPVMSFPRRRESTIFGNRCLALRLTP